ncbi:MAG: hypothetical protein KC897_02730 [Candidatus Omnitrophica bacterium]|nr:hypothetical protein [Candidatus Omnitrophota bacterium]MCB9722237.1 hypothetical protein [Candidatus Omnitrophota bacterium]
MAYQSRPQSHVDANLVRISVLGPALLSIVTACLAFYDAYNLEVIYAYLRITGWGMLASFLCSFGASTIYHFFPSPVTRGLLLNRKYFGLAFAVFITFHFYGLYLKMDYDPVFFFQDLTVPEFVLGVVAIVFTLAMTFTSSAGMQQRIGAGRWAALHTWGGYGILFAFWVTYRDHGLNQLPIFLAINGLIILRCLRRLQELTREDKRRMIHAGLTTLIGLIVCSAGLFIFEQIENSPGPPVQRDRLYAMRDYYPLREGAAWTYRTQMAGGPGAQQSFVVRPGTPRGRQAVYRVHAGPDTYMSVALDSYGIRIFRNVSPASTFTYEPAGIFLPNLYLYEEKTFETGILISGGPGGESREGVQRGRYRLEKIEDVILGETTYRDCMRIAYSRTIDNGQGFLQTVAGRMWLAPGVGKVRDERSVKVEDTAGALIDIREEQLELVDGGDIQW